jgi:uncharacterized membrane protein YbaN (DUF454 family)
MKLKPVKSKTARLLYLLFGFVFLIMGVIGLLLPILPGWLFLIPAALCFAKASTILSKWLRKRKSLQKYFSETQKV